MTYEISVPLKGLAAVAHPAPNVRLSVTTPPSQVPRLVSAGVALSDYEAASDYSSTAPRHRMLWMEFAERPRDPEDAYFVRVLAVAPDPMLTHEVLPETREPPLPVDPEWVRLITPGQPKDDAGARAMQKLEASPASPVHYLIPLPDGLDEASFELFGFFVYEIRLGHTESRWCTAQGRFGPALRVSGVQHPTPPLICHAARGWTKILVRAPYATPVHQGRNLRPIVPRTHLWALLYARVRQADGMAWRNLLLARRFLAPPELGNDPEGLSGARAFYGEGRFALQEIQKQLARFGLPGETPLTALAAEVFGDPHERDPLGADLGQTRLLRISPLVPVSDACY